MIRFDQHHPSQPTRSIHIAIYNKYTSTCTFSLHIFQYNPEEFYINNTHTPRSICPSKIEISDTKKHILEDDASWSRWSSHKKTARFISFRSVSHKLLFLSRTFSIKFNTLITINILCTVYKQMGLGYTFACQLYDDDDDVVD